MKSNMIITANGILGTHFPTSLIETKIKGKKVIVIDNGTYGTSNYHKRQENVKKFLEYGAKEVELLTVDNNHVNQILLYDVCYVMGGNIANLLELIQTTNIKEVLEKFLEKGMYIGESAGGIILDDNVKWYFDLKKGTKPKYDRVFNTYQGLGFIHKHIYPHFDQESEIRNKQIQEYKEEINFLNDGDYVEMLI